MAESKFIRNITAGIIMLNSFAKMASNKLSRTSALAQVGYEGVYPGRGQMSSTSSDAGGAYSHAPLNM